MKLRIPVIFLTVALITAVPQLGASGQSDFFDKTLVLAVSTEPKTFNVMVAQETSSTEITQFLFEGLTEFDPRTGQVVPKLAAGWEHSADGLIWTFHLQKNAQWSDGTPFTAEDVQFTFEKIIFNAAIPNGARDIFTLQGKPISVRAVDESTVEFRLPEPFAPFLFSLAQPIVPKHILEKDVQSGTFQSAWGLGEDPTHVVGTGPFRLSKVLAGERIELVRNDHYWKKDAEGKPLPRLERILFLIIPSPENQLLRFLDGETDVYTVRGVDYPVLKPLESRKNFRIYRAGPSLGSYFVAFNQQAKTPWKKTWFQSRDFREALAFGIDRNSMIDIVFNKLAVKQCSPLSPSVPFYYDPAVRCYNYDPVVTQTMLADVVGLEDKNKDGVREDAQGHPLEIVMMTNAEDPTRLELAQMIREDWRKLGIKVHLQPLEFNTLVAKLTVTHDWEAVLIGLTGPVDPHFGANVWLSNGNLHFWNHGTSAPAYYETKIDELFHKASAALDPEQRKVYYKEWQYLAAEELPLIYTVAPEIVYAVRDRFGPLKPTPLGGPFYPIEELEPRRDAS